MDQSLFADVVLYISYALVIVAALGAIVLPLINSLGEPKTLIKTGIGLVGLIVVFGVSYAIAGDEVTAVYTNHDVETSGASKLIGGTIVMMYVMLIGAILGIVFTEVAKNFK